MQRACNGRSGAEAAELNRATTDLVRARLIFTCRLRLQAKGHTKQVGSYTPMCLCDG